MKKYDTRGRPRKLPKEEAEDILKSETAKLLEVRPGANPVFTGDKRKPKVDPYSQKRGRISRAEDKLIVEYLNQNISVKDIAVRLNRPESQVDKYCRKFHGRSSTIELPAKAIETAEMVRELRKSKHWRLLKEQYRPEDLEYYEELYASIMADFREDISTVDQLQVLQALDSVILINKHKKYRREVEEKILDINHQIEFELSSIDPNNEKESARIMTKVRNLEDQKQALIAQSNSRTKEFTELSQKFDKTVALLKQTRDQRMKTSENSKQSFTGLIRHLQDRKVREKEGRHMELVRVASEQAKYDLSQPHKYINGQVDQPLLTSENVLVSNTLDDDNDSESDDNIEHVEHDFSDIKLRPNKIKRMTEIDYDKVAEEVKSDITPFIFTGPEKGVGSGNYTRIKGYHTN